MGITSTKKTEKIEGVDGFHFTDATPHWATP